MPPGPQTLPIWGRNSSSPKLSSVMVLKTQSLAQNCSRTLSCGLITPRSSATSWLRNARSPSTTRHAFGLTYSSRDVRRGFTTESTGKPAQKPAGTIQISTLLTGLLVVGVGITAYGLYVSLRIAPIISLQHENMVLTRFGRVLTW